MSTSDAPAYDLSVPPLPGKQSAVVFPTFTIHQLSNGIPTYIVANHAQPFVSMQIVFRGGASDDGELPGLASFMSDMLLSGAGRFDAQELAEEIDFLGATLDVNAGRDETSVQIGVLTKFLPQILDLAADVVLRPTFPADEITRQLKQAIAALKQNQSDPSYLSAVQFRREIYGASPYGTEIDGTQESLRRIKRNDLIDFHRRCFTPDNAFIVAAGDVEPESFLAMLEERFSSWTRRKPAREEFTLPNSPTSTRVVIVDRPGSVQSSIRVGTTGIARGDADYIPMTTLNTLFGGYFNSRINHNLREVHGYTYGARSSVEAPKRPGSFSVSASVRTDVTADAIEQIFNELRELSSHQVKHEELEMVKNYIVGSQALQIETPGQVAAFVRMIVVYNLPLDYFQQLPAAVRSITEDQLLDLAQRRLSPERMIVVVAGDAASIREKLEKFGPVTVVDEKGRTE